MHRSCLLVALALLSGAAGCTAPPESAAVDAPSAEATLHLIATEEFSLRITRVAGAQRVDADNCLSVDHKYVMHRSWANLTWTPATEAAGQLTLEVDEDDDSTTATSGSGPSPRYVEFGRLVSRGNDRPTFDFMALLDDTGVIVDQPVTMDVHVEFREDASEAFTRMRCSVS